MKTSMSPFPAKKSTKRAAGEVEDQKAEKGQNFLTPRKGGRDARRPMTEKVLGGTASCEPMRTGKERGTKSGKNGGGGSW